MAQRIVVVGSTNVDFVTRLERIPAVGETVTGGTFHQTFGGKGANTALAAARTAAKLVKIAFVSSIGDDVYAEPLLSNFKAAGIDVSHVAVCKGYATGCANILVDAQGRNCIAVSPGANAALEPADIDRDFGFIRTAALVLLSNEISPATVNSVLDHCEKAGVPTLMNYAPAGAVAASEGVTTTAVLPVPITAKMTGLIVNETEAAQLSGMKVSDASSARAVAGALLAKGPKFVVVTLGAGGAYILGPDADTHVPAFPVKAVDTTAAGDAFTGALAVALVEGKSMADALRFATATSALVVTKLGAQESIPVRADVEAFLKAHK